MSPIPRLMSRAGGKQLRRVSPEKARPLARGRKRAPIPQRAEKVCVLLLACVLALALLGVSFGDDWRELLGLGLIVLTMAAAFVRCLADFQRSSLLSTARVISLSGLLLVPLAVVALYSRFGELAPLTFLPLSCVALVVAIVWNRAMAIVCAAGGALLVALFLARQSGFGLGAADLEGLDTHFGSLCTAFAGALVAGLASGEIKRRNSLVRVGLLVGAAQVTIGAAFVLLEPAAEQAWGVDTLGALSALGVAGVMTGLVVSGILPNIEKLFGVTTQISLLELGSTNDAPLLRKLLTEAPGTFHHSYVVGLLAEGAAEAVGVNVLLTRVGALYHDIGKMNKPEYFAENSTEARERHKSLSPEMSTLIISAHPRDGVELGRYHDLPQVILDFMPEHHGTSRIDYFFQRARDLRGEDNVNEEDFRYPGPKPQSIETAIVMLADAAEAISRQMPDPTRARLDEMVHEVAMKRLMDGQFSECPLTLRDLERIEFAFVRVLTAIYHTRPTFPKGRPHPLDLSQPGEQRRSQSTDSTAKEHESAGRLSDSSGRSPEGAAKA